MWHACTLVDISFIFIVTVTGVAVMIEMVIINNTLCHCICYDCLGIDLSEGWYSGGGIEPNHDICMETNKLCIWETTIQVCKIMVCVCRIYTFCEYVCSCCISMETKLLNHITSATSDPWCNRQGWSLGMINSPHETSLLHHGNGHLGTSQMM